MEFIIKEGFNVIPGKAQRSPPSTAESKPNIKGYAWDEPIDLSTPKRAVREPFQVLDQNERTQNSKKSVDECEVPLQFCDDMHDQNKDDDGEVYFGKLTTAEKHKAAKFHKRRTVVFFPGFRKNRRLMRSTIHLQDANIKKTENDEPIGSRDDISHAESPKNKFDSDPEFVCNVGNETQALDLHQQNVAHNESDTSSVSSLNNVFQYSHISGIEPMDLTNNTVFSETNSIFNNARISSFNSTQDSGFRENFTSVESDLSQDNVPSIIIRSTLSDFPGFLNDAQAFCSVVDKSVFHNKGQKANSANDTVQENIILSSRKCEHSSFEEEENEVELVENKPMNNAKQELTEDSHGTLITNFKEYSLCRGKSQTLQNEAVQIGSNPKEAHKSFVESFNENTFSENLNLQKVNENSSKITEERKENALVLLTPIIKSKPVSQQLSINAVSTVEDNIQQLQITPSKLEIGYSAFSSFTPVKTKNATVCKKAFSDDNDNSETMSLEKMSCDKTSAAKFFPSLSDKHCPVSAVTLHAQPIYVKSLSSMKTTDSYSMFSPYDTNSNTNHLGEHCVQEAILYNTVSPTEFKMDAPTLEVTDSVRGMLKETVNVDEKNERTMRSITMSASNVNSSTENVTKSPAKDSVSHGKPILVISNHTNKAVQQKNVNIDCNLPKKELLCDKENIPSKLSNEDYAILLEEKKAQLLKLREERERLQGKIKKDQTYAKLSQLHSPKPKPKCTSSDYSAVRTNLPKAGCQGRSALVLSEKELEAVTRLHTICNGKKVARMMAKAACSPTAVVKHSPALVHGSRIQWRDSLIQEQATVYSPSKAAEKQSKPILSKKPFVKFGQDTKVMTISKLQKTNTLGQASSDS